MVLFLLFQPPSTPFDLHPERAILPNSIHAQALRGAHKIYLRVHSRPGAATPPSATIRIVSGERVHKPEQLTIEKWIHNVEFISKICIVLISTYGHSWAGKTVQTWFRSEIEIPTNQHLDKRRPSSLAVQPGLNVIEQRLPRQERRIRLRVQRDEGVTVDNQTDPARSVF